MTTYQEFEWRVADAPPTTSYLLEPMLAMAGALSPGIRILDVGCGDGYYAAQFAMRGCTVVGIDLSESGIAIARERAPDARFELLPADEHLLDHLGEEPFDVVISSEVVEHLYDPRGYARGCFAALRPGGTFVCTTPYHGYLKNLVIALAGRFDRHVDALWDGGHIKFWSRGTLTKLLSQVGFAEFRFAGSGRLPYLWKSMILSARRPESRR